MIKTQKHLFNLEENITYINGAFMSPLLQSAAIIGKQQVDAKQRPYQITGNDFFNDVKSVKNEFSDMINASNPDRIAIIPSVSYGIANVVKNVNINNKEILVVAEQFPSNIYPWMEMEASQNATLKVINPPDSLEHRGQKWNERLLESINEKTGMVAIAHVHWADGTLFNLKEIRKKTREVGALLIIDGTQSVGAYPFDVKEIDPDALICAGYKWLMGPYGIGVAYYGSAFDNGSPFEQNWINRKDSENFAELVNYQKSYQPGAGRYSMGEQSNFILIPMLLDSLKQINKWSVAEVQAYCEAITKTPIDKIREKGYWVEEFGFRSAHLFGIRKQGLNVEKLKQQLEDNSIFVSIRGSSIRVSPNVYNTEEDLMNLVDVLN